jgi:hypothetical protein
MSVQFQQAIKNILAMPYFKNDSARSGVFKVGHEDAVAVRLEQAEFVRCTLKNKVKSSKKILKKWAETGNSSEISVAFQDMSAGSFILQPAGTQSFPDILVRDFSGSWIALECKSVSRGGTPMWNDNVPQQNAVYVLSSGTYDQSTTVFLGKDVISKEAILILREQERAMNELAKTFAARMKLADTYNRGWIQKSRRQNFQQGGSELTNWFTHQNRNICEQNVLKFALLQ